MTEAQFGELTDRIDAIHAEIRLIMPEFIRAGGRQQTSRVDMAHWARELTPLFREHDRIMRQIVSAGPR